MVRRADGGDGRQPWHCTLEGGRKWPESLHMAEKHLKIQKTKQNKTKEKQVKGKVKIKKRERRLPPPFGGNLSFHIFT